MPTPRRSVAFALAGLLAACASQPESGHVQLTASRTINPGAKGAAQPVDVRLYALKSSARIAAVDWFQLADNEKDALGEDLLGTQQVAIRPGETQTVTMAFPRGTTTVGVAAGFQRIDRAVWRATLPLPPNGNVAVSLDRTSVSLSPGR